ncbi:type II toxin-antitoxin system HipA family toxin [Alteromonas oceanisediminis]|uniref:type II toxin-antitoxin system HipA family toxin n=1 Tax=Alteromonas oceanisediminis TaxID=2836180 RepID=UPI001BDAB4DA|nr:type II toxin-antitoxin system HipA family toxin [Alteromonas oceanisediminis]MBT0586772.1 type II toxin-antitoxin system HipA family toxin [Alteromonas oceanisediminis]
MGRKSHTRTLFCSMNGFPVGELYLKNGRLSFKYDHDWLEVGGGRAISLSLPMQRAEIKGEAVHAYFDNLLPDTSAIREHIKDRLGADSAKPFDLLDKVGKDCVGALTFTQAPATGEMLPLSLTPLSEGEVAQIIRDTRFEKMLGMNSDDDFRISLAGAQEKTALTLWEGRWCRPHGSTPTTHILKPPILHHESLGIDLSSSVDNEWFCQVFMKNLGLDVADCEIAQFEDQKILVVKRFDRRIEEESIFRLPQEDMCQALGKVSGSKYEEKGGPGSQQIMKLLSGSKNAYEDRLEFLRVQIVFWLLAAIDGHAKNFSIALDQDGYRLTPYYDVLSAYPYFGQGNIQAKKIKMAMKVHSKNTHYKWSEIMPRHWPEHAKKQGVDEEQALAIMITLNDTVETALNTTLKQAKELFDMHVGEVITEHTLNCLNKMTTFLNG